MFCPYCQHKETRVVDKRDSLEEPVSRRRRECQKCNKRFTTYERIDEIKIKVTKKDGALQNYSREKLAKGIHISAQKRISDEEIEKIVDDIEMKIMNRKSTKVSASDIGRMILTRLKEADKIAYMRFASVFLDFDGIDEFNNELKKFK